MARWDVHPESLGTVTIDTEISRVFQLAAAPNSQPVVIGVANGEQKVSLRGKSR